MKWRALMVAMLGALGGACATDPPDPPRTPVSDRPIKNSADTCHEKGSSCNYNDDCCSNYCNYPMETCN